MTLLKCEKSFLFLLLILSGTFFVGLQTVRGGEALTPSKTFGENISMKNFSAPLDVKEIRIRDPFIVADKKSSLYYMYAQAGNRAGSDFSGVEVYVSKDLKKWSVPVPVLKLPKSLGAIMVWAPEVHFYKDAWYLFVTLTFEKKVSTLAPFKENWPPMYKRGTWIFKADSLMGPFKQVADDSLTPADWMALDGTLLIENEKPFMIFCHEWVQLVDGTINAIELTPDLAQTTGASRIILAASSAPGAIRSPKAGKVTDGPFFYKSAKSGSLFMIWSTFIPGKGYCVLATKSNGGLAGPWSASEPLFMKHGGHGMIFNALDGRLLLALHQPENRGSERLALVELIDTGDGLKSNDQ